MTNRTTAVATIALTLAFATGAAASDWPGFRGPNGTGSVTDELVSGNDVGLSVGWKRELGSGYSAVAVADGRAVTMFSAGEHDVIAAFDTSSGDELWRHRIAPIYRGHDGSHDGPISTPLIAGDRVFGLGPYGQLFALSVSDGAELWVEHLADDLGGKAPDYGFTTSPAIASGVLIIQLGGEGGKAIAGFDPATGEQLWTSGSDEISFQSPVVATIAGREQVLAAGKTNFYGLDAKTGKVLWTFEHEGDDRAMGGHTIVPLPTADGRVFLMNQLESSTMVQIERSGADFAVSEVWTTKAIKRSYVSPVYHDGHIYGMSGRTFTCIDAATGDRVWRSRAPGDGFPIVVGDHIVVITKPGSLHIASLTSAGYDELASLELFDAHSWSEPAFAGGSLFVRSMAQLARVDIESTAAVADAGTIWLEQTAFGQFLAEVGSAADKPARVKELLAQHPTLPIIEPDGTVHFLYHGEAEDVGLVGDVIGYRREDPMTRVDGTDLFYYSVRLEPTAAVTYGFLVDYAEEAVADPRNARPGKGLFGDVSWFAMPGFRAPDYLEEAAEASRGRLEDLTWESAAPDGASVTAKVFLPAGYDGSDARYPVAYVQGGDAALDGGAMKNSLDNLIDRGQVQAMIAVFVLPLEGEPRRGPEAAAARTKSIVDELIPKIDAGYRTMPTAAARASIGAGRAGNAAILLALDHPELFGRIGSQGASFLDNGPIESRLKSAAEAPYVLYLEWGTYHLRSPHEAWDMARSSREAWQMFRDKGYRPAGGERPEGYGWACWRAHTDALLRALFPVPTA